MTAKFLVIDDMRTFKPSVFDSYQPGSYEVTYARTSEEGLAILREDQDWDIIHLDHDLGGVDTVKPCLDYILEFNDRFMDATFFVHTGNPYEKDSIYKQLEARDLFAVKAEASEFFDNDYSLWAKANGLA